LKRTAHKIVPLMSVLYLLTSSEPIIQGTDAAFQEVSALSAAFNGETINLCPRRVPGRPFPAQLLGFHKLRQLRKLERACDITHVYHSVPYPFPVLKFSRNPIVYTVLTSLRHIASSPNLKWLKSLHRIVVSNVRDADILKSWGLLNSAVVPPAVDISRVTQSALPLEGEITLLMASAPWVEDQFDLKGIDALLDAAARLPKLRLILLWRGLLLKELLERVERHDLRGRVEIITERVEINDVLRRSHAAVLAAKRSDIVKAYPHSLLESLLGGKPVILSDMLPMADYVRQHGCGIVLEDASQQTLINAIEELRARYDGYAKRARLTEAHRFSHQAMIENYREIYELKRGGGPSGEP
jgi:glycosyltransferase involved in cell wall biosynthesis